MIFVKFIQNGKIYLLTIFKKSQFFCPEDTFFIAR